MPICVLFHASSIDCRNSTMDNNSFELIFNRKDSAETFAKIDEDRKLDLQSLMVTVNIDDIIEI
jgi:hypothetical protein